MIKMMLKNVEYNKRKILKGVNKCRYVPNSLGLLFSSWKTASPTPTHTAKPHQANWSHAYRSIDNDDNDNDEFNEDVYSPHRQKTPRDFLFNERRTNAIKKL